MECQDEPAVPAAPVTNRQNADYTVRLRFAGADCRSKLREVRRVQQDVR